MYKNLYIKTYGCQMNVYDSIKIGDLLKPFGYQLTESMETADMIVLNTCHIREKATEKVYSELGQIRKFKEKLSKDIIIVVAGCVGQAEGKEIFKRAPWVSIVVGPQSYQTLPELLALLARKKKHVLNLDFAKESKFDDLPKSLVSQGPSAFLSIQEGCDKFCRFCCVPYTRGAEFSRSVEQIYQEALLLASQGSKEITLLGQNVNAYHGLAEKGSSTSLAQLIEHIAKIDKIERIRYSTSHPVDMSDDLIEAHGSIKKLMPFLHLPVQSGSNKILAKMNRTHTIEHYIEIIEKLKKARPGILFSSDFIVGYPEETDKDFQDTLELVKKVKFAQSYSFKYSPRPGTPASIMQQIPEDIKNERLQQLQKLLSQQQKECNQQFLDKTLEVLIEKKGRHDNQYVGRSEYMQAVSVNDGEKYLGKIVKVKIDKILTFSLGGEVIENVSKKEKLEQLSGAI
jgi:tRNA-2-methylthio-N6-dimethylallyladenosine synthase